VSAPITAAQLARAAARCLPRDVCIHVTTSPTDSTLDTKADRTVCTSTLLDPRR
jgi:hypothetical protein